MLIFLFWKQVLSKATGRCSGSSLQLQLNALDKLIVSSRPRSTSITGTSSSLRIMMMFKTMISTKKLSNRWKRLNSKFQLLKIFWPELMKQSRFNKLLETSHQDHQLHSLSPKCHCQLFRQSGGKISCSDLLVRITILKEMREAE